MSNSKTAKEITRLLNRKSKVCFRCKKRKKVSQFAKSKTNRDGLVSYCYPCDNLYGNEYRRKQRAKNPTWYRNRERSRKLRLKYGLTTKEYKAMLKAQNNTCCLCPTKHGTTKRKTLFVDHCHKTNKVRALLCNSCNKGLGDFRDSPDLLRKAANYLEKFN